MKTNTAVEREAASSWLCRLGWHRWGKWFHIRIHFSSDLVGDMGKGDGQKRICELCGKEKITY